MDMQLKRSTGTCNLSSVSKTDSSMIGISEVTYRVGADIYSPHGRPIELGRGGFTSEGGVPSPPFSLGGD